MFVQQDATQSSLFIILQVHSTCFGCQPHPCPGGIRTHNLRRRAAVDRAATGTGVQVTLRIRIIREPKFLRIIPRVGVDNKPQASVYHNTNAVKCLCFISLGHLS